MVFGTQRATTIMNTVISFYPESHPLFPVLSPSPGTMQDWVMGKRTLDPPKGLIPEGRTGDSWAHLSCFSAYSNILIRRTRSVLRFSCPFLSPWRKAT